MKLFAWTSCLCCFRTASPQEPAQHRSTMPKRKMDEDTELAETVSPKNRKIVSNEGEWHPARLPA
jgi:hypothetical protein